MRFGAVVQSVALMSLAACGGLEPSSPSSKSGQATISQPCGDPFTPVFEIMNQQRGPESMGCRGCHIGPEAFIPWGDTQDEVLTTLEDRDPETGEVRGPVRGGRSSDLAYFVHEGIMPLGGLRWGDAELTLLDTWLITYE